MGILDEIFKVAEKAAQEQNKIAPEPPRKRKTRSKFRRKEAMLARQKELEIRGYPLIFPPLKWDDLGLGLLKPMGFIPNKAVQLSFKEGMWTITGARVNSTMLLFILAGAGGLIYFLQDLVLHIEDWGGYLNMALALLIPFISLFVRNQSLQFNPYEIEMLGYDPETGILVLSTLTLPGGVIALKLDLPKDDRLKEAEEIKIIANLQNAHTGFIRLDGLANPDYSKLKHWSLWALVWVIIFYISNKYF